jgi:hypothetical protein
MNSNAIALGYLNPYSDVFIAGQEDRIADGPKPCQFNQVRDDERVDPFLLTSTVYQTQPNLDVIEASELFLLDGRAQTEGTVVP